MAGTQLTDIEALRDWAPNQAPSDDAVLKRLLDAATTWIENRTGRKFQKSTATTTEIHDGDGERVRGRGRSILLLNFAPVDVTVLPVLTENGVALTIATGYTTTADVVLVPERGELIRRSAPATLLQPTSDAFRAGWLPGVQNIAAVYTPGYTDPPADIQQVAIEVAWLIYKQSRRVGKTSMSRGGTSVQFADELSTFSQSVLTSYERWTG